MLCFQDIRKVRKNNTINRKEKHIRYWIKIVALQGEHHTRGIHCSNVYNLILRTRKLKVQRCDVDYQEAITLSSFHSTCHQCHHTFIFRIYRKGKTGLLPCNVHINIRILQSFLIFGPAKIISNFMINVAKTKVPSWSRAGQWIIMPLYEHNWAQW
jgi:hypothetical protein